MKIFLKYSVLTWLALCTGLLSACGGGSPSSDSNATVTSTSFYSQSGAVTLNWTPPIENTDGSQLVDLSGYRIYYGKSDNDLLNIIEIQNPGLTSYMIENLETNSIYYFAITAINNQKIQSGLSNVVQNI